MHSVINGSLVEEPRHGRNVSNSKYIARKRKEAEMLTQAVNSKRALLGLPEISLNLPHKCPFKGKKRPVFNPPVEVVAQMTKEELHEWRLEQRKNRKKLIQRVNCKRKKARLEEVQEMLRTLEEIVPTKENVLSGDTNIDGLSEVVGVGKGEVVCDGTKAFNGNTEDASVMKSQEEEPYDEYEFKQFLNNIVTASDNAGPNQGSSINGTGGNNLNVVKYSIDDTEITADKFVKSDITDVWNSPTSFVDMAGSDDVSLPNCAVVADLCNMDMIEEDLASGPYFEATIEGL